jgi:ribosome biogenesis GTPase A
MIFSIFIGQKTERNQIEIKKMFQEKAIQLITTKNKNLVVLEESLKILKNFEAPLIVVCITGNARRGKSTLLNLFVDKSSDEGFKTTNFTEVNN